MNGARSIALGLVLAWALGTPHFLFGAPPSPAQMPSALSESDLVPIFEKLNIPKARVLAIRPSPVAGFWEVGVENGGRRFVIYVDPSKKYVTPGPFLDYANRRDITRERIDELNKDRRIDVSTLSLNEALVIGKKDAPLRVIVFTDPGCPHCAKLHPEMKKVADKRPDIVFFLKLFIVVSPDKAKVKSVVCSRSLSVLEQAYEHKEVTAMECSMRELDDNIAFARANGIDSAPTLIFPDGSIESGSSRADELEKSIDRAAQRRFGGEGKEQRK